MLHRCGLARNFRVTLHAMWWEAEDQIRKAPTTDLCFPYAINLSDCSCNWRFSRWQIVCKCRVEQYALLRQFFGFALAILTGILWIADCLSRIYLLHYLLITLHSFIKRMGWPFFFLKGQQNTCFFYLFSLSYTLQLWSQGTKNIKAVLGQPRRLWMLQYLLRKDIFCESRSEVLYGCAMSHFATWATTLVNVICTLETTIFVCVTEWKHIFLDHAVADFWLSDTIPVPSVCLLTALESHSTVEWDELEKDNGSVCVRCMCVFYFDSVVSVCFSGSHFAAFMLSLVTCVTLSANVDLWSSAL